MIKDITPILEKHIENGNVVRRYNECGMEYREIRDKDGNLVEEWAFLTSSADHTIRGWGKI